MQALGKFIGSSGIPTLMVESGLIAEGSVRGFLAGTHFNRCKRIHPAAALSFKILHFKEFLKEYNAESHCEKLHEREILQILNDDSRNPDNISFTLFLLKDVIDRYNSYTQKTLNDEHGCTAKFALMYAQLVELYQLFERAIRTSDFQMYIYAAHKICALFFTFNHQNYARWLTRNLDDLMNIEETHAGLLMEFESGALSVRRTKKNFCRSAVDLTLEQTINANAANRLTGITAFRNSVSARQRWSETHTVRTAVTAHFLEMLNLVKLSEDSENEYHSKVFRQQTNKFMEELCKNINPFSGDINQSKLFNLSTGKAASEETTEFLLNVDSFGAKQMKTFISECHNDCARFDRPIKRNTIKNFTVETCKTKNPSSKRTDQTRAERNVLGQVLCLAINRKIDLQSVLSYPLTSVPHSLAHFDGSMLSNSQKGEITTLLTSKLETERYQQADLSFDVDVTDGFYLLNSFQQSPIKYGQLAIFVLRNICDTSSHEVHIIFDEYEGPSPRDVDSRKCKELYESVSVNFKIRGPNQQIYSSLTKCLLNRSFRGELIKFLIDFWSKDETIETILKNKRVFLSFGKNCYLFCKDFEKGKLLSVFENNHFEVESKMILHISKVRATNIYIRAANIDTLLVYLLYHMQYWANEREIIIETKHKNQIQLINVRKIFVSLSPCLIQALPAWYFFTGCAYEPSFHGKGRKTCMKILEKNPDFQTAFGNLGSNLDTMNIDVIALLEEYTCQLYGSKDKDINRVRFENFQKAYGSKTGIDLRKKGKFVVFSQTFSSSEFR